VVGIVHAALAPVIVIGGAKPNLALAAVVLVTTQLGFGAGVTWAFVTGLTVNLLVGEPLGTVPLGLLLAAALVAGGQRVLGGAVWVYPIPATFAASLLADAVSIGAAQLLSDAPTFVVPGELVLAAATLNAAIVGLLLFPARTLALRLGDEAPSW
jgi:rod shape-determining protein MreD